jgi:hypothetical protein
MPALFLFDIGEKRQKYQFLREESHLARKLLIQVQRASLTRQQKRRNHHEASTNHSGSIGCVHERVRLVECDGNQQQRGTQSPIDIDSGARID